MILTANAGAGGSRIYKPQVTIPVASSFEGVVNNGAPECGLVSANAYPNFFALQTCKIFLN